MNNQCCGNCGWGIPHPDFQPNGIQCRSPMPTAVNLVYVPISVMAKSFGQCCPAWKPLHNGWIPVSERVPEKKATFEVTNGLHRDYGIYYEKQWISMVTPTHWRELPELPKP